MVLCLAVHTVPTVTAKVPFGVIMLLDAIKSKSIPPEFRCRQVLPTSGLRSISLWDVSGTAESLQLWLDEFMEVDCNSEVFEVQEEFALGLSADLLRMRAAERVSANTRAATQVMGERTREVVAMGSQQVSAIADKYHLTEQAASVAKVAKDTGSVAAKNTAAVFEKVSTFSKATASKAMQNEQVASTAQVMGAGLAQLRLGFGQGYQFLKNQVDTVVGGSPHASDMVMQGRVPAGDPAAFETSPRDGGHLSKKADGGHLGLSPSTGPEQVAAASIADVAPAAGQPAALLQATSSKSQTFSIDEDDLESPTAGLDRMELIGQAQAAEAAAKSSQPALPAAIPLADHKPAMAGDAAAPVQP